MPAPPMTTWEYFRTPETVLPQELVFGLCREAAAPTPWHQFLVGQFFLALSSHVRGRRAGEVWMAPIDVVLDASRHLVVQPDLIVVSNDRLHLVRERVWGAPDLAVEVLSPEPRIGSVAERLGWFATAGVTECWLVHQLLREVEVVRFEDGRFHSRQFFEAADPIRSAVLPAFHRSLADIIEPSER